MSYVPKIQDIVQTKLNGSKQKMPAVVLSISGYSKITNLVVVAPIVKEANESLKDYFIPIKSGSIEGFINPFQTFTLDLKRNDVKFTKLVLPDAFFFEIIRVQKMILNL
ncbi:hypothetical protein WR164_14820 [Philodulcilactobacillus myokoensis]|uniref:Type II toxin-antitoxin system PemK/MazF family toxin n=1 Tax=Philodulcilactobacillus myokoensis TaxID=2929573 RepID=A0A9W6B3L2_9LACO|nr:type II toxin-antitoxin system PemK/MazF family toxin [Philodulcilactobacillus myokoensis]GLB47503.1 hypothetical protein WR164_14820 [Philodulcilactobacillus myokoensis]